MAFGAWDIFYYVFLRLISGWPKTCWTGTSCFLLPLPWWGPVLAPVSIALVMIVWGTLVTQSEDAATGSRGHGRLAGPVSCWRSPCSWPTPGGASERPSGGDGSAADDVQLAAVLGGVVADGLTGPASRGLLPAKNDLT
jgi:hypothetical protein